MLLSADSLTIIFVKIYCYWTRTVGVIAKGSRGSVFLRHSVVCAYIEGRDGWSVAWSGLQSAQDWESAIHWQDWWTKSGTPATQDDGWQHPAGTN